VRGNIFSEISHSLVQYIQYLFFVFRPKEAEVYVGNLQIFCDLYAGDRDKTGFIGILNSVDDKLTENFFDEA
jgi:hypothetical protein